jgi:regulatory protein
VERAGSSSSASDNATVIVNRVRPHHNYGAGVVVCGDTAEFRVERADWDNTGLTPGDAVRRDDIQALERKAEARFCRADAIALLARREHSRFELEQKLALRRYSSSIVGRVLDVLIGESLLSDQRFAEAYIRSRFRRGGESRIALMRGLAKRGVSDDVTRFAIEDFESDNPGCFEAALEHAVARLPDRVRTDRVRALRAMARKGFRSADVWERFP